MLQVCFKLNANFLNHLVCSLITHTNEHVPILLNQGCKVTIDHQTLQWNVVEKEIAGNTNPHTRTLANIKSCSRT